MDKINLGQSKCDFCLSSESKYRCSRCQLKYCSPECFKSVQHIQCSEQFFKQCVTEELLSQSFDESSKQKFLEILRRNRKQFLADLIEDNGEDDEEKEPEVDSFESRFNNLDISDVKEVWNKLNDSEKQEFNELLRSGKISDFIEVWNPWWKISDIESNGSLVEPLDETVPNKKSDDLSKLPDLVTSISTLDDLISKPVSPSVCTAVVNTLLSYCYVCRLFNGDYDTIEAIQTFIKKCPQLSDNINCDDFNKSLEMCVQNIMTEESSQLMIELLRDIKCLIEGPKLRTKCLETPEYVLRALSDLIAIINRVNKSLSKQKRKDLKLVLLTKKLEFYLSWTVANGSSLYHCLHQINLMIDTMVLFEESNRLDDSSDDLRTKLKPKTLIQEIN